MVGAWGIRSKKLREVRYREGYARSVEGKRVERDGHNVEHMWDQVESAREVCRSVKVGGKSLMSV